MNNQEIFDQAVGGVLAQGEPAAQGSDCHYRINGKKCAIGMLIPDELYQEDMEGSSASEILRRVPTLAGADTHLLGLLQQAHDDAAYDDCGDWEEDKADFRDLFREQAIKIAQEFGLNPAAAEKTYV